MKNKSNMGIKNAEFDAGFESVEKFSKRYQQNVTEKWSL
jgi:hypothetical protein